MSAPLVNPLLSKAQQATSTAARAAAILRDAFPEKAQWSKSNNLAVPLPRHDVPTYVVPNQGAQPWELLPMKAAALRQYPNFFHYSCTFFGSIKRDVTNGLPICLLRPTRLAIDLAKVVRNLGIVDGFDIVQRRNRLKLHDFVWTEDQPEPNDMYDVALFKQRLIRLRLRTDMHSLQPSSSSASGTGPSASPAPIAPLAPAFGLLPLSVRNMSRASQPVLMYPAQMEAARSHLPSGLFICYHHELGLITDAVAEHHDVPALVSAHLGLPMGMVAAIRGALRLKAKQEAGVPLRHVTPLKSWNMVEALRQRVAARRAALDAAVRAGQQQLPPSSALGPQADSLRAAALEAAESLEDGLLAEMARSALPALQGRSGGGGQGEEEDGGSGGLGGGGGGGPERGEGRGAAGRGQQQQQQQWQRRR